MDTKKLIVLCAVVIIVVVAVCGAYIATYVPQQDTEFRVLTDQSLYEGDEVIVKLITKNETPVANQSVNVTVVGGNGEGDIISLVTNESGMATFELEGLTAGDYTLVCVFGGSAGYKPSNDNFSQEIKEHEEIQSVSSGSSSGACPHGYSSTTECPTCYNIISVSEWIYIDDPAAAEHNRAREAAIKERARLGI